MAAGIILSFVLHDGAVCDNMGAMKQWLCAMLAGVGLMIPAYAEVWALRLPETALVPSYAKATYVSRMHERHGGSHMGMQDYTVNLPFVDARRSHVGSWWYNIQANVTATIMDVGGTLNLRRDELFEFGVPVTIVRPLHDGKDKFMFTIMPRYSGDDVSSAHAWDLAMVADYSIKHSETLTYSIGLAASPRFAERVAVPYVSFYWQSSPDWLVRLRGYQLSALYRVTERLSVGPALGCLGGTWMVSTPKGQRILRVRSLMAAVTAEYNFAPVGKPKRVFVAALGSTLATSAELCNRTSRKDTIQAYHYKPGVVASLEVDFRF